MIKISDTFVVAVTGATGFIGRALCRRLIAKGIRVRALVRSSNVWLPTGVERMVGDLADGVALQCLCRDADAVIHCAGAIRGATVQSFDRVNVDGLRHLLAALGTQNKAIRLFYLSSLAASQPQLSFYAASKRRSEQLLLEQAKNVAWVAVRPPVVYGPGDKALLPLWRLMAKGWALVPGSIASRFSLIYIDDLVEAITTWLHTESMPSGIYSISDGCEKGYSWSDIITAASGVQKRPIRCVVVPGSLLSIVAGINSLASRLMNYAPMLTPGKVRELCYPDWVCSNAFSQHCHWKPTVLLEEGISKTLGAFRSSTKKL